MNFLNRLTSLLLMLTLLMVSGAINAESASGLQNLSSGLYQGTSSFNLLMYQGKSGFSYDGALGSSVVTKGVKELTKSQQKGIRSLEKQISKHQQKLDDFKANPTVRPGMENLPKDVIQKQQQARIKHLETEINTFKNNIEKIKNGDL